MGVAGHGTCLVSTTEGSAHRLPSGNTAGLRGAMQLMATLGLTTPRLALQMEGALGYN